MFEIEQLATESFPKNVRALGKGGIGLNRQSYVNGVLKLELDTTELKQGLSEPLIVLIGESAATLEISILGLK